mgnify:CR=1 FL=1
MATLNVTLTLQGTDLTSDELNFSVTDTLSVKSPSVGMSKITIDTTGANSIVVPANDNKQTWVFLRHTGEDGAGAAVTTEVEVELTGNVAIGTLKTGEWLWFPHCGNGASTGIQLQSSSGAIEVEYAYWSDETAQ